MNVTQDLLPQQHPLAGHDDLIDQLRECGRLFHSRGWSVGTSSNYSAVLSNDPVELIVTASGKDKGRLDRTDFVHVGEDGRPIEDGQAKSSAAVASWGPKTVSDNSRSSRRHCRVKGG